MSENRFSWETEKLQHSDDEVIMVIDNANKEWKGHILNIVDLLNSLAEENEQLKQQIKIEKKWQLEKDRYYVDLHKKYDKLEKENEQLKQEHKIAIDEMITDYKNLEKENEQLRKETVFLAYWKRKAMILLMQVRRLTPRMTDEEVMEFSRELEDE